MKRMPDVIPPANVGWYYVILQWITKYKKLKKLMGHDW